jgi:hypothetical protein
VKNSMENTTKYSNSSSPFANAMGYTPHSVWLPGNPGRPSVFPLVTSANDIDIISLPMELGLCNQASVPLNDEHSEDRDLCPPAHDILKEITKVDMKEVPDVAPKAGV